MTFFLKKGMFFFFFFFFAKSKGRLQGALIFVAFSPCLSYWLNIRGHSWDTPTESEERPELFNKNTFQQISVHVNTPCMFFNQTLCVGL